MKRTDMNMKESSKKSEGLIKNAIEHILNEVQTVLSLGYVLLVTIGMFFQYERYSEFGINIFQYADVFDFLIAPFEDFDIIFFFLVSIGIIIALYIMDIWMEKHTPKFYVFMTFGMVNKSWYKMSRIGTFIFLLVLYVHLGADYYGKSYKRQFLDRPTIQLYYTTGSMEEGRVIGKTNEVLFFLVDQRVKIIPMGAQV